MTKTVVVTGGSRGIGREICLEFARLGYNVVVCFLNSENEAKEVANEVRKEGGMPILARVDVANMESVRLMAETVRKTFGRVDVLVNCAGVASYQLIVDVTESEKTALLDVNLKGTINTCQAFAQGMINAGGGKIINISSMWGVSGGSGESVYSASKAGINGFSMALAKELGLSNINVNVVAPGTIMTGMTEKLSKDTLISLASETALGRLGTAKEVAKVVTFLASDDASYITGQVISVDGGRL